MKVTALVLGLAASNAGAKFFKKADYQEDLDCLDSCMWDEETEDVYGCYEVCNVDADEFND